MTTRHRPATSRPTPVKPTEAPARRVHRAYGVSLVFTLLLVLFGVRLFDLQIVRHHQFATQSENNFQRDEVIRALRGEIRTRDGLVLATNRMAVDLIYKGGDVRGWERIRYLTGYEPQELPEAPPRGEVTVVRNVPADRIPAVYEYVVGQPNLELRERLERMYPRKTFAAHLIGYTGETNEQEVNEQGKNLGDLTGRSGLEASLNTFLTGRNGILRREVTAEGRPQSQRVVDPGRKGTDVTLTIDGKLQEATEQAMRDAINDLNKGRVKNGEPLETVVKGAIIALDPRTNEVLAFASSPPYDPNWFSQSPRPPQLVDALRGEGGNALLNRVVNAYDSGSVFKPSSTLAYIEKFGNKTFECTTSIWFGAVRRNWATKNMGMMDGADAIAHSCNTWYYQAAIDAGPIEFSNLLARRMKELGFGGPTGIEIIGEKPGNVPSADQLRERGDTWYPGQTLSYAIGQDQLLVTPAQIAYVLSTLVNEGVQRPLTVVKAVGEQPQPLRPAKRVPGAEKDFKIVKYGMELTALEGTSKHMLGPDRFPVRTGGKTGTAENSLSRQKGYAYTNAWYEGYGPLDDPNLLVVAFFENAGEGSGVALPATVKVMAAHWCVQVDERGYARRDVEQKPCPEGRKASLRD